jgi:hypothetical protein
MGQITIVAIETVAVLVPVIIRETGVITTVNLELYEVYMKWPGHEDGDSFQSSTNVKNHGVIPPLPHMSS